MVGISLEMSGSGRMKLASWSLVSSFLWRRHQRPLLPPEPLSYALCIVFAWLPRCHSCVHLSLFLIPSNPIKDGTSLQIKLRSLCSNLVFLSQLPRILGWGSRNRGGVLLNRVLGANGRAAAHLSPPETDWNAADATANSGGFKKDVSKMLWCSFVSWSACQ